VAKHRLNRRHFIILQCVTDKTNGITIHLEYHIAVLPIFF
jgi:hypothetical protein